MFVILAQIISQFVSILEWKVSVVLAKIQGLAALNRWTYNLLTAHVACA